jgi:hypothetical protein
MIQFILGKKRETTEGELVKENPKTVWIKLADGNIIKRHRIKHDVK